MPTFRLDDDEIRAIGAFIWQSGVKGELPAQKPGDPEKGKEAFETRGCMACHSMGEGRPEAGRHVRRQPEPRRREGQLRLPGALGPQSAPAHRALLRVREEGPDRGRLRSAQGLPYVFDLEHTKCPNDGHELQVQQMTPMPSLRLTEDEARDIASYLMTRKHDNATYPDARLHGRSQPEEPGPRAGAQLRLRRLP